jgi:hypothetical protein
MDPIQAKKHLFHGSMTAAMCTQYIVNRFSYDSIAANSTAILAIPLEETKGSITAVKCQCDSTDFSVWIYPDPVTDRDSIMTIYESLDINKKIIDYLDPATAPIWCKYSQANIVNNKHLVDQDTNLYLEFENNAAIATGPIYFEITHIQLH